VSWPRDSQEIIIARTLKEQQKSMLYKHNTHTHTKKKKVSTCIGCLREGGRQNCPGYNQLATTEAK